MGSSVEGAAEDEAKGAAADLSIGEGEEGLLLVWYDEQAKAHTGTALSDVPDAHRERVRVGFTLAEVGLRAPPGQLFVADLRVPGPDGRYALRAVSRRAFDAELAARVAPATTELAATGDVDGDASVVLYGTSWCGACKQARRFLKQQGVPFVDRDIERDQGARAEMQRKARAQGVRTSGVPIIDVNGTLMTGFDPGRLMQLLRRPG